MKKYFLFLMLVLFTGCTVTKETPKEASYYKYDFRPYTEKGFMFTTEGYNGYYESVGMVYVELFPEVRQVEDKSALGNTSWKAGRIFAYEAIDSMYNYAKGMGADAIIRFNINSTEKVNGINVIRGIEVRGFAIKRK